MMLGMTWAPTRQTMYCDDQRFTHEGLICTHPSHDLAHLLVRACSNLPWMPSGNDRSIRLAEYNATILEHFLHALYNHAANPMRIASDYGQWFVEKHFRPFPVTSVEAWRRFREGVDWDALTRLSPYFFSLKKLERASKMDIQTFELSFKSDDSPSKESA